MLNTRIPWQRSYKYLGVTLDKNLHFREHIARVRKNALFYTARLGAMLDAIPAGQEVTVSGDTLCRGDILQESSIGHVTRRRHSHVPSGRAR
ncbi:hypothetical protein EVAR_37295_1 [Eumeta japonica]|uniref:Uncharacterized protein n=1 Tax=Eumeta variegata TaxID=151549 RepID=A0A4C1WXX8_EUMVA|nr:hypothetical protein EVAR_37295_1 [Eumeta japonica]